jgi:Tfp pilus assembly major pilin PilA
MQGIHANIRQQTSHRRLKAKKTRQPKREKRGKAGRCIQWKRCPKTGHLYNPTTHRPA